ncbi:MAG: 2TM domain-containing protein [Flavobacterium sp.]|uniref:2TM domain-containing protein n=1 Tax=Flavobacterium sp. TaxID=239 RepID=UPI00326365D0
MESNSNEFEKYQRAYKQVQDVKGFYGHLLSYVLTMMFFVFINLKYTPKDLWFYWPMLGWGIGLLFHGLKVFRYTPFMSKDWEERKIKEFMDKEKQNKYE